MMKLSQLVSSALEDAQAKVASAKDAEKTAGRFDDVAKAVGGKAHDLAMNAGPGALGRAARKAVDVAGNVGKHLGGTSALSDAGRGVMAIGGGLAAGTGTALAAKKLMGKKKDEPEKVGALDTAVEAMKLAESLEHLAMLFPKLAEESAQINDVNGPAVMVSPNMGATKDSPTKATSVPAHRASSGGGSGPNMAIETNKNPDAGDQNYAAKAAQAILEAKVAQSNALLMAGHAQAATQLAKQAQVEFLQAKRAYEEEDASTNTPKGNPQSLAVNRNPGDLPVPSGPATDNAGMIAMTKRQAKTEDVRREAGKHVQETALSAASDKGLTDNLDYTEGAKIANIFRKVAARKQALSDRDIMGGVDTSALDPAVLASLKHRASMGGGIGAGLVGAIGGGELGYELGGGRGALLGAGLGGLGAGALGYGVNRLALRGIEGEDAKREATKGLGVAAGKLHPDVIQNRVQRFAMGAHNIATPEEIAAAQASQG